MLILSAQVSHKFNYVFNLFFHYLPRCDLTRSLRETCTMVKIPCFRSGREDITSQFSTRWDHPYSRGALGEMRVRERSIKKKKVFGLARSKLCSPLSVLRFPCALRTHHFINYLTHTHFSLTKVFQSALAQSSLSHTHTYKLLL